MLFSLIIVGVAYSVGAFDKPESTSKLSPKPTEPEPMSNDKLNPIIFHILNLLGMSSFIALITISSSTVQISSEFYLIEWGARSILYLVIIFPIIYVINYLTSNIFFYEAEIFPHILLLNFLLILNASPLFYILALVLGIIHYFQLRGEREKEIEGKKDNQVKLTNEFSYFEEFINSSCRIKGALLSSAFI